MNQSKEMPFFDIIAKYISLQSLESEKELSKFTYPLISKDEKSQIFSFLSNGNSISQSIQIIASKYIYRGDFFSENNFSEIAFLYIIIAWFASPPEESISKFSDFIIAIKQHYQDFISEDSYACILYSAISQYFKLSGRLSYELIPQLFDVISPQLIDSIILLIDDSTKMNDLQSFHYFVDKLIEEMNISFDSYININFDKLVTHLASSVFKNDIHTLNFFAIISSFQEIRSLQDIFSDFPSVITTQIQKYPVVLGQMPTPVNSFQSEFVTSDSKVEFKVEIDGFDTFPNGLLPPKTTEFETNITFESYFDHDEYEYFDRIKNLFHNCLPFYSEAFFESYSQLILDTINNPYWADFYCSFQYFLGKAPKIFLTSSIFDSLLFQVFNPKISSFNKSDHFDIIQFFRINVLNIISQHKPPLLNDLLMSFKKCPFLFADLIGCIHLRLSQFNVNMLTNEIALSAIIHVVSILDDLNHTIDKTNKKSFYDIVQQARSTIFLYLFALIENPSTMLLCFSSSVYTSGFLSRVFEPSLQKSLLLSIRQFLSVYDTKDVSQTLVFIGGIIDVCRRNHKQENLALELLTLTNDAIGHNPKISSECSSLLESVSIYATEIPSPLFLSQTLQLYSQLSINNEKFQLTLTLAQFLSRALNQQTTIDDSIICKLIGIMSRSLSANDSAMFFIHSPLLVLLLMSVIDTEEKTHKYLALIYNLCHYSIHNCIQCHKGEFDLFLLELVKNQHTPFSFRGFDFNLKTSDEDMKELVIPLLCYISGYICSPQFFNKLIATLLLFSDNSNQLMNSLCQSVSCLSQQPKTSIMAGYEYRKIFVSDLNGEDLKKGFTIHMTLQCDSTYSQVSTSKPILLSISDDHFNSFTLFIQNSSIVVKIINGQLSSSAPMVSSFPSCQWVDFVFTITEALENTSSSITFWLNGEKHNNFTTRYRPFHPGPVKVQIGGLMKNSSPIDFYVSISNFGIYPGYMKTQQVLILSSMARFNTFSKGDREILKPLVQYPSVTELSTTVYIPLYNYSVYTNIFDVGSFDDCFRLLIPLFYEFNRMPNHFPEVYIDFIHCLIISRDNPKLVSAFPMIAHILLNHCDPKRLTYSIYMKFFGLLENCSNIKIIHSIITNLLFNVDLWISSESSQLTRIVNHWCNVLYSAYPNIMCQFSNILVIVRLYFWYSPIEIEYIRGTLESNRPRPQDLDIDLIKHYFAKLLLQIAETSFDRRNASALISHCATCSDTKSVLWMMSLFVQICKITKNVGIKESENLCRTLYVQFKPHQEERFVTTLQVIYILSGNLFLKHLYKIMSLLNNLYYTDFLFEKLLSVLNEYPLIFPLCILVSINVNQTQKMASVLNNLIIENPTQLFENEIWPLFPLILAHYLDNDSMINLAKFMMNLFHQEFHFNVLDNIIEIGDLLELSKLFHVQHFLKLLLVTLTQTIEKPLFENIFYRCMRFSFLHLNENPISLQLWDEYQNSPFYDKIHQYDSPMPMKKAKTHSKSLNLTSFFKAKSNPTFLKDKPKALLRDVKVYKLIDLVQIFENVDSTVIPQFRIRIDEQEEFIDFNSFESVLKIFLNLGSYSNANSSNFIEIIDYFLNKKKNPNDSEIEKQYSNIQHLINQYVANVASNHTKKLQLKKFKLIHAIEESSQTVVESLGIIASAEIAIAANNIDVFRSSSEIHNMKVEKSLKKLTSNLELTPYHHLFESQKIIPKANFFFSHGSLFSEFVYGDEVDLNKEYKIPFYHKNPNTIFACNCLKIKLGVEIPAVFEIQINEISIITANKIKMIPLSSIELILQRNRLNRLTSLEFFVKHHGKSYLLDFYPIKNSQIAAYFKHSVPNYQHNRFPEFIQSKNITYSWTTGKESNYKYLMYLNFFSGRSLKDLTIYPIMPLIVNVNDLMNKLDQTPFIPSNLSDTTKLLNFPFDMEPSNTINEHLEILKLTNIVHDKTSTMQTSVLPPAVISHYLKTVEPYKTLNQRFVDQLFSIEKGSETRQTAWKNVFENIACFELPPAFFFASEYFDSNMEFVYKNRRVLESDEVSSKLHLWIDSIWGVGCNTEFDHESTEKFGVAPLQLFTKTHPIREYKDVCRYKEPQTYTIPASIEKKYGKIEIIAVSRGSHFLVATSKNQFLTLSAMTERSSLDIVVNAVPLIDINYIEWFTNSTSIENKALNPAPCPELTFIPISLGFIMYNAYFIAVYQFSLSSPTIFKFKLGPIQKVLFNEKIVGCINENCQIALWDIQKDPSEHSIIAIMHDQISSYDSIAISYHYKMIVYGTLDSQITAISLDGLFLFSIQLDENVKSILITESFGFILVMTVKFLYLFSSNGTAIRKTPLNVDFVYWTTLTSSKNFDFIVAADGKGQIYLFEAFFLQYGQPIYNCRTQVSNISFSNSNNHLIIIGNNNKVFIIPSTLPYVPF